MSTNSILPFPTDRAFPASRAFPINRMFPGPPPAAPEDDALAAAEAAGAAAAEGLQPLSRTFHIWHGASSRRYVHLVYSLLECPDLPECTYVIAAVDAAGRRTALRIDTASSPHGSLNLAQVRRHAGEALPGWPGRTGAEHVEIHVSFAADGEQGRLVTVWDLQAGAFGQLLANCPATDTLSCDCASQ